MSTRSTRDRGFTLVELLVVVVVIGVLAAIAIPIFLSQKEKAATVSVKSDLRNAALYLETFYVDHGTYESLGLADQLAEFSGTDDVTLTVQVAEASGYCLEGRHDNTGATFYLHSGDGAIGTLPCFS